MNVYKIIKQDDGDILLKQVKTITCGFADGYVLEPTYGGGYTLEKTSHTLINEISQLKQYEFPNEGILTYGAGDSDSDGDGDIRSFDDILWYVYGVIGDGIKIIKHSTLEISTLKRNDEFHYIKKLGISVRRCNSNNNGKYLYEIVHQCIENGITFYMTIQGYGGMYFELDFGV
jgi:hypothetical protein